MAKAGSHQGKHGHPSRGLVRSVLVTLLALPMSLGWLLPAGAAPITATVCLRDSNGAGISGAEAFVSAGSFVSLGLTDATGCVSTDLPAALGNRTFRILHRGLALNKTQNTSTNPNVTFQTVAVNLRLLDSTGVNGIPGATVEYNAGGWQSLGSTDATGTITTELLGLNTQFRVTLTGQTQNKTQNTSTNPNVTFQTGRVLQGTGPRILAWFASGWHPFTNGAELLPGNVNFDFNTGPNKVYTVLAGATIYVPFAPTTPVVTAADQSANEGQTVALSSVSFLDQETTQTHRATIDWGDGSALATGMVIQANGLAGTVTGDHVFADEGSYNVEVCVSDDGNPDAEDCDALQLTVSNLDPSVAITGAPLSVVEEEDVTLGSVASDPGSADVLALAWTVTVDAVPVATGTGPDFSFAPDQPGWYVVTLVVNDGDGGTASAQVVVEVTAVPVPEPQPAPQPPPQPQPVPELQPAPEPRPEPNPKLEQPAPEQLAVEIGETINNATSQAVSADATLADPDQSETAEAGPQPATEPGSETAVDPIELTDRSDEVRLLALVAVPPSDSPENIISTSLLLGLIWLGPVLVILARTRLRRSQE